MTESEIHDTFSCSILTKTERMEEHNEYVKEVTPPTIFHTMNLSEGWAPLCKISGTLIPDEPFPRANDLEAIEGLAFQIFMEAGTRWLGIFVVIASLGYSIWYLS
jgi:hypothetical protein